MPLNSPGGSTLQCGVVRGSVKFTRWQHPPMRRGTRFR